ncbi:MAG: DUF2911 domain-containing protein [Bacteroidota bacterium]
MTKQIFSALLVLLSLPAIAQIPSLSPLTKHWQQVGNTTVTLSYERPAARGRQVFGGLVSYGKVWRTGAGHCTKIGFSQEVWVNNQAVPAGKYSLFTIPTPDEWTIILNQDTTLYGSSDYDPNKDIVRFKVPAQPAGRYHESLTFTLDFVPDNLECYLTWENTMIQFSIETSTGREVASFVDSLLQAPISKDVNYAWPAEHLLYNRGDLNKALELVELHLRVEKGEYPFRMKMEILHHLGYNDQALAVVKQAQLWLEDNPMDEQNQAWSLAFWRDWEERLR